MPNSSIPKLIQFSFPFCSFESFLKMVTVRSWTICTMACFCTKFGVKCKLAFGQNSLLRFSVLNSSRHYPVNHTKSTKFNPDYLKIRINSFSNRRQYHTIPHREKESFSTRKSRALEGNCFVLSFGKSDYFRLISKPTRFNRERSPF